MESTDKIRDFWTLDKLSQIMNFSVLTLPLQDSSVAFKYFADNEDEQNYTD